jgi:hypothetical protein
MSQRFLVGRAVSVILGATFAALATGCSSGAGAGGPLPDGGLSGAGGWSGSGGSGGSSGAGASGGVGVGGEAGTASGGTAGAGGGAAGAPPVPMCSTSADCGLADVSYPGNTDLPISTPTECAGDQCGLLGSYNGSYQAQKTPKSCNEICAASTYEGQPMKCSAACSVQTINGFGDQGLVFGTGDGGTGSVAGLARFQFSTISGAYEFEEVSCSEVPPSKLIKGSNSYKYVSHHCCCFAP